MKLIDYNNAHQLKKLSDEELMELINAIKTEIRQVVYQNGGHLASNLGVVPLIVKILQVFDIYNQDIILFDTGHQTYAYKILTDRKEKFISLRLENGLEAFQNIAESPFDYLSNGHSGTALSIGMGYSFNPENNVICVIGDAAFTNGLTLQALSHLATLPNKITLILNDNDTSISKNTSVLNIKNIKTLPNRTIKEFFTGFNLNYLGPIDGENLKQLTSVLNESKKFKNSVLVHVKTNKIPGLHSYAIKSKNQQLEWTRLVANEINSLFKKEKFYFFSPAMQSAIYLEDLFIKYPNFFIDVGIAEEHAALMACGLVLDHHKVFVSIYSTFFQRIYDQLVHDIIRSRLPIIFLLDRAGLAKSDGESHHGIYDLAMLYPFGTKTIIAQPASNFDLHHLLKLAFDNQTKPFFIRYPRYGQYDLIQNQTEFDIGQWEYLINDSKNKKIVITYGNSVGLFYQFIKDNNLSINLVNARFINPIDNNIFSDILMHNYKEIIIYEEVAEKGGLFDRLSYFIDWKHGYNISHYAYNENFIIKNWKTILLSADKQ